MKNITRATVSGTDFWTDYQPGDSVAWIGSVGNTHEILVSPDKKECFRIAVATTPPAMVSPGCRPWGIEDFIEKHLDLKCVGQAQR